MSVRFRYVAPAGAPIHGANLIRWAGVAATTHDASATLRAAMCQRFGVSHSYLTSTGRAGMTLLLKALRRLAPERTDVIVPSYTCFSVAASIVKAGLRPRIVDISPDTLDFAPDQLAGADFSRVLAVVPTNLYGLPNDLPAIEAIAHAHGAFVIDDAAQAMGASVGNRPSGTSGDAGLFSLDKGKNVSAVDGGVIVTSDDTIADAIEQEMKSLANSSFAESIAGALKALAYSVLLRPSLYWIPNGIPQLGLGRTVFTTDYPLGHPSRALMTLAIAMLDRLEPFTRARVANAATLLEGLRQTPGIRTVLPTPGSTPVYLRLPLLMTDTSARRRSLERLHAAGIGATGSYPASLADVPELTPFLASSSPRATGGRYVAERILTLPTHPYVSAADLSRTIAAMTASASPATSQVALTV